MLNRTGPPLQTKSFNIVHQQIPIYERGHKKDPPKHLNFLYANEAMNGRE